MPEKFSRKQCLVHKQAFFQCMDDLKAKNEAAAGGKKPRPGAGGVHGGIQLEDFHAKECAQFKADFRGNCLESWVKHFEIQRFGEQAMVDHGMQLNDPDAPSQVVQTTMKGGSAGPGATGMGSSATGVGNPMSGGVKIESVGASASM